MTYIKNQFVNSEFRNTTFDYNGVHVYKMLGDIPTIPNLFIGRGASTEEIHSKLTSNKNVLLLINGTGGIGKTTMASQYYYEYFDFYSHLIWVVSEKGIKEAIISLALSLQISFSDTLTQSQQITEILRQISELKKPVLLIIDNANDLEDLNRNNQLLRKIYNVHILLTSRINSYQQIESYKVEHLDKKYAIVLFKEYFPKFKSEEQSLLENILDAVGYNTLVIELLAKNLNEYNTIYTENYPLKNLLDDIQRKGILSLRKSTKVSTAYKLNYAKPEDIIRTMYDISNLLEIEKQILSIFAVFPAMSIPFNYIKAFLPEMEEVDMKLNQLSQKGWIDKGVGNFKTNPIISEIVREQNKDRLESDIENLTQVLISSLEYDSSGHLKIPLDFNTLSTFVNYAETLIIYTILKYDKHTLLLDRLGNFYMNYGNLDKALKFFEDDLNLTKELYKSNPNNVGFKNGLAISYSKLGSTHTSLGNLDKALKFFEDETELFEELYKSNPNNVGFKNGLAISYEKLGSTHTSLGNLDKALKFFEERSRLGKELYKSNPNNVGFKNGLAISYIKLGALFIDNINNKSKAIEYLSKAKSLLMELKVSYPMYQKFKKNYDWVSEKIENI